MAVKFTKVLVPFDGSAQAIKALEVATAISKRDKAKLTVLYVMEPYGLPTSPTDTLFLIEQGVKQLKELTVKKARYILKKNRARGEVITKDGHPAEVILKVAKKGKYDLIVMGNRGLSDIDRFFLGSVTDAVVHHAHCTVMVVK